MRSDLPEQGEGGGHPEGDRLPDLRFRERVRDEQQPSRVGGIEARETNAQTGGMREAHIIRTDATKGSIRRASILVA